MITVSLTTIASREKSLEQVIKTLLPQVDKINVYLHGYTSKPDFLVNDKIRLEFDWEYGDRKDNDKFYFLKDTKQGYHIIVDDDLIFTKDFVSKIVKECKRYKNKVVVGYHGRIIGQLPIASYYLDSTVYPCLGTVPEDVAVDVLGTGCICYHTGLKIQFDIAVKECFMSDIHFSMYCKEKEIPMIVLKHEEGYIKHYPIDMKETIFAAESKSDFIQTNYINSSTQWYNHYERVMIEGLPIISIIVANTRLGTNPDMVKRCYDSLKVQSYPNIEIIVIENYNREYTLGKCWNDGIRKAKGDWLFFIGDDDFISPDYINTLAVASLSTEKDICQITTYLTMFRETAHNDIKESKALIPTGMWRKSYLLEYPPLENKNKFVDTVMMSEIPNNGYRAIILDYHYGYYYRSHTLQTSGMKLMGVDK